MVPLLGKVIIGGIDLGRQNSFRHECDLSRRKSLPVRFRYQARRNVERDVAGMDRGQRTLVVALVLSVSVVCLNEKQDSSAEGTMRRIYK